jgi:propanol-preferring alcohol dehydrogenase
VKAWQLTGAKEPLRRIERDDPRPGPGQAVVDVRATGICHSDVGFIDGTMTPMLAKAGVSSKLASAAARPPFPLPSW